ncbi:MAG: electron transport complex subunit RsxC [Verrucomicrobia bacterium]|nr:electron transport complex subunit RsxC [Verrucomicrobiota bacterium]
MLPQRFHKHSFSHGIHPPQRKDRTAGCAIRRLPFAPRMIIPLSQHTGAPATPTVREGQEVVRGEPIAQPDGFVSVPMHSPATGMVERIAPVPTPKGGVTLGIYIKLYPGAAQEILYGAPQDLESMSPEELTLRVQATGVVGLGGAAFPTHVKLAVPEGKTVDTIIVNGCECEPYLTTDHRVMLEQINEIVIGAMIVCKAMKAERIMIGVEDNKPDAVAAFESALQGRSNNISIHALPTKYPQGAEKMLAKALLNREIPSGGLPADVGLGVFNVATLAQIGELLPQRRGLIERVVTVTGAGVTRPGNYLTALGTPLRFLLEQAGFEGDARQVILGGPMMGPAVACLDLPVTKGITGVLVLTDAEAATRGRKTFPCIKCGECVDACPMHLNPSRLGILARAGAYEVMDQKFHLKDCFECGCCSFVCPSDIPLVQQFRMAKARNRERMAAS